MSTETVTSFHLREKDRRQRALFLLFQNDDIHTKFLLTSCTALHFDVSIISHLSEIEQSITTGHYEIILIDTRTHTSSTVLNLLKLLTKYGEYSWITALWSPRAGADHRSKLHFLLALLKAGVDRILQETDHLLSYFAQLLFIREIDLLNQQTYSLGDAMSAIVHQWPQSIRIVNTDFDVLYQNPATKKRLGKGEDTGEYYCRAPAERRKTTCTAHGYSSWKGQLREVWRHSV